MTFHSLSSQQKTYICTSDAVKGGFCDSSEQGQFILDLPSGKSIDDTSFWLARVSLGGAESLSKTSSEFWENPQGNPEIPEEDKENASPWRPLMARDSTALNPSPSDILQYKDPIIYQVRKTGYYCVGQLVSCLGCQTCADFRFIHSRGSCNCTFE